MNRKLVERSKEGLCLLREQYELWHHKVTQLHLLSFSKTPDTSRKFPLLSCSPFHSKPQIDLHMGVPPKHCVVHPCMGEEEHPGFEVEQPRVWVTDGTPRLLGSLQLLPLPPYMKPIPLPGKHSKETGFTSLAL